MIAWPMPISRSRLSTMPAIDIDRHEKNAAASQTAAAAATRRSGFVVRATPSSAESTSTTTTWLRARTPAANALPAISATRGVGVTRSLARTPASRSQMIWIP